MYREISASAHHRVNLSFAATPGVYWLAAWPTYPSESATQIIWRRFLHPRSTRGRAAEQHFQFFNIFLLTVFDFIILPMGFWRGFCFIRILGSYCPLCLGVEMALGPAPIRCTLSQWVIALAAVTTGGLLRAAPALPAAKSQERKLA